MNDRPDSAQPRLQLPRRILTAVGSRLEGRWDDAGAWRVLCEEAVAAWRVPAAGVRWALLLAHAASWAWATAEDIGDRRRDLVGGHRRDRMARESLRRGALVRPRGGAGRHLLAGEGRPQLLATELVSSLDENGGSWLAGGVAAGKTPSLMLLLGLECPSSGAPGTDAVAGDLLDCTTFLGPLLGQRRHLVRLAAEVAAVRAECETLSRLGELRAHLAAVTAHELKTPLTSITAYAEVLEQQAGDPDFAYGPEFLRVISSESDRLLRLVDRLLDSTRRGRSQALAEPQPVAVDALVDQVLRTMAPLAAAGDLQLVGRVPGDMPAIAGDDDLVRQVLLNLIGNALKFTPAGGRVVLAVREDTAMIRLAVTDTGPGIAPRDLRAIFQSFYRTRAARRTDGVGLGLSIVKEITNLHGGHLDVQSRLGRGTTFSVLLPKEQRHAATETVVTGAGFDPARQRRLNRTLAAPGGRAGRWRAAVAVLLPDGCERDAPDRGRHGPRPGRVEPVRGARRRAPGRGP